LPTVFLELLASCQVASPSQLADAFFKN
jgi:hypothetical protein